MPDLKPLSKHEEDYLKAIFQLQEKENSGPTESKDLASLLNVSAASVSGMLKKIREKGLVEHSKYGKVSLSNKGQIVAVNLIRKHRLWETFLHEHMNFSWDEVHDVAEQLEHIRSIKLIREMDKFLGFPKHDPHGDPIPDAFFPVQRGSL
jgi:DtxR family Mn-dependent transcriptional regulator